MGTDKNEEDRRIVFFQEGVFSDYFFSSFLISIHEQVSSFQAEPFLMNSTREAMPNALALDLRGAEEQVAPTPSTSDSINPIFLVIPSHQTPLSTSYRNAGMC